MLNGKDYKVTVSYKNRWGRERRYSQGFGVFGYIKRKHEETESDHARTALRAVHAASRVPHV